MRAAAPAVFGLAAATAWTIAAVHWPALPDRIPIHFDLAGRPDGWAARGAFAWFGLAAFGTMLGALLAFALPMWMVRLARRNSPWLNVPNRAAFHALPEDARVRAVAGPARWLVLLGAAVQALVGWLLHGSARVAAGEWQTLSPAVSFAFVGAVLAIAVCLAIAGTRAVRREVERAAR